MPDPEPQRAVLVVEDDTLVRFIVVDILEDAGFEVVSVDTADKAIQKLADGTSASVVVSDIEMPGTINGIGLAHWLHQHRPSIGVVLISGRLFPVDDALPQGA